MTVSAPTITLFRGFPTTNQYTYSAFVTKLEARLRFDNVAYTRAVGSPFTAPRGKLPYITLQQPGSPDESLGDSTLISRALVRTGLLVDRDARLSAVQRAQGLAVTAMLEDRLYFYQGYERWIENFVALRSALFAAMAWPLRMLVGYVARSKMQRTLYGQGTGRYEPAEIAEFRGEVWQAVNDLLVDAKTTSAKKNDEPFWLFGGDEPSDADATVFGFIASGLVCDAAPASQQTIASFPAVMDYAGRIHRRYFPDYEMWRQV